MEVQPTALDETLRQRWRERFPALGDVGDLLVSRYDHPTRVYHDVRHLDEVLTAIDLLHDEGAETTSVELAAWFHDAVYDVRRSDNEATSAELAESLLTSYVDAATVAEVVRLVLITENHIVLPGDRNAAVLCDADLAILASPEERYDDYAARIRLEFAHFSDEEFRAGRRDVLRSLLDLPSLFNTDFGARHWEAAARDNIRRELASG